MPGTFILSLDCEGKWGMADHLTADHDAWLTTARLKQAYRQLLDLFGTYRIDATFAFVMAFLLTPAEQREHEDLFQDQPIDGRNWLRNFRTAQADGRMEGWTLPELLDMVRAEGGHEVGAHGFSHLPLDPAVVSREVVRHEIAAAATIAAEKNIALQTFIYPRNLIGYPEEMRHQGYVGFRDRLRVPAGRVGRMTNLLSEFNIAEEPQPHAAAADLIAIPSGFFFNWRSGPRRFLPKAVTVLRWKRLLDKAAADGGVVHLWLHPHNIISGPETFEVLADVVALVADLRDRGLLEVVTQERYCASRVRH